MLPLAVSGCLIASLWWCGCDEGYDGGAIVLRIRSEILQQDRDLLVRLPAGYDSTQSYPTVYVLDGSSLDIPVADAFARTVKDGRSAQVIVVGVPNMSAENRANHLTPPVLRTDVEDSASQAGQGDRFLSFMEHELIPFVEQRYRSTGTRAIAGNSRGGLLVVYSLVARPEMFQARFCFSAPLWRQDHRLSQFVRSKLDSTTIPPSFFYISAGEDETERIRDGFEDFRKILEQCAPPQLVWRARVTPDAEHQDNAERSVSDAVGAWLDHLDGDEMSSDTNHATSGGR